MISAKIITATNSFSVTDLSASLQNFLICWEMALAAIIHHFIFSRRDFKKESGGELPAGARLHPAAAFLSALPHDVVEEGHRVGVEVAVKLKTLGAKVGKDVDAAVAKLGGKRGSPSLPQPQEGGLEWRTTPLKMAAAASPTTAAATVDAEPTAVSGEGGEE